MTTKLIHEKENEETLFALTFLFDLIEICNGVKDTLRNQTHITNYKFSSNLFSALNIC